MNAARLVATNVAVWLVWSVTAGYLGHRLPDRWLRRDRGPLRLSPPERSGALFRRIGVRRWKDLLPEAGGFFAGGVSKRRLPGHDTDGLERFELETRRAEITHLLVIAALPVFALWNPWTGMLVNLGYALAANVPCIVVQRYNRMRLERVRHRRSGRPPVGAQPPAGTSERSAASAGASVAGVGRRSGCQQK